MLLGTGAMAASVAVVLVVQSVASYTTTSPIPVATATTAAAPSDNTSRSPVVTDVSVDTQRNVATLTIAPFTSENTASALGAKYGMDLLAEFPAFGRYVFSLPQIRIGPGPELHTATIYFPPYATTADINAFMTRNGLGVSTWVSTEDATGRTAVVTLPQIQPHLIDEQRGIWQASVPVGLDRSRLDGWASANGVQIIGYDPNSGEVQIQGPKPQPVYTRVVHTVAPVVTTTTPPAQQTSKLYIAFKPGTTFSQAQQAIEQAGGQVTSFDSGTGLAAATVPVGKESQATTALTASPQVSCVGATSTACPATTPPADTTATGNGWTTTTTPTATTPAPTTPSAPLVLQATPTDGHVSLSWSVVSGATGYQVYRSTGTEAQVLIATTTATILTDTGGTTGTSYGYSIVPVLSAGPDPTQAQSASATWTAASSSPVVLKIDPASSTLSGSVAFSVDARTGDGAGSVTWSITSQGGSATQVGTATGAPQAADPLTWSARTVWDSHGVADGEYTLVVTVADGSGHSTQTGAQVRVSNAAPAAPTALGAATVTSTVVLTWRQPATVNGAAYLVQKDTDVEPVGTVATGALSWTDETPAPGSHTYKVVLEDKFGNTSPAASVTVSATSGTRPLTPPTLTLTLPSGDKVAPDGAVDDRLMLVSDASAGSGVAFQYAGDGGAWQTVHGTMSCAPTCTVDWNVASLPRGHYSVRAEVPAGVGQAKGFTLRGDGGLPAPSAPTATITPFGVSLHWSQSQGEMPASYAVSRLDGNSWVVLDRVIGTQYVDRSAQPGKNQYRVQAYNSDGAAGQASATTGITVPDVVRPSTGNQTDSLAAPIGVHAVAGGGSVTLLWNAVPQAAGYTVERAWQADGPFRVLGTTGEMVYGDSATVGAVAYYRVRAFSGNNDGPASQVVTAALVPVPQPASSTPFVLSSGGLAAPPQSPGTLTLGSSQTTGSAGSTVDVSASGQGSVSFSSVELQALQQGAWVVVGQLSAIVNGQTWTASGSVATGGLSEGSHQVRAVGVTSGGAVVTQTATSVLNVVHTAPTVTGLSSSISGDSVRVSWTAVAGGTYNVYRSIGSGYSLAATSLSASSFLDASLAGAQSIAYVVTQIDVYGNESAFSETQWITTPAVWSLMPPDLTILTPNAADRPDQAIVDLVAQVSSHIGVASVDFSFAPIGSSNWTAIPNVLPTKPATPSAPGGPWVGSAGLIAWSTSFSTAGLAAGKYVWRVTATDNSGRTAQQFDSFAVGAVGARGPPTPGFNLNSTATSTGVQLTWTGAAGDLFQVRRAYGSGSIFSSLGTTSATNYVDTAVLPGSSYQYQVVRLSPSIAFTAIQNATAVSSFNSSGKATSSDGNLAVGVQAASSERLAVGPTPATPPPAMWTGMTAFGTVYNVNASSLASGAPVHRLDQPATLAFAPPAGTTQAQAPAMSVFHWDAASQTWVREPTTLDWPNRQLIATVNHFSFFTLGATCDGVLNYLCWTNAPAAVISLKEPTGVATLHVSDGGGTGLAFFYTLPLIGTIASGSIATARSAMTSLIINAGKSNVEISGTLDSLAAPVEVDGSSIKLDSAAKLTTTSTINLNATYQSNGHSLLGITTTLLGVNAGIELDGATLSGSSIDLE